MGHTIEVFGIKAQSNNPRAGWEEAFAAMAERGDDRLIDGESPPTRFDEEEWQW